MGSSVPWDFLYIYRLLMEVLVMWIRDLWGFLNWLQGLEWRSWRFLREISWVIMAVPQVSRSTWSCSRYFGGNSYGAPGGLEELWGFWEDPEVVWGSRGRVSSCSVTAAWGLFPRGILQGLVMAVLWRRFVKPSWSKPKITRGSRIRRTYTINTIKWY